MNTEEGPFISFLKEIMRHRRRLPSQLAADLGVNHTTVSRWVSGIDIPNIQSCQKISLYSGRPLGEILSLVGHLPPSSSLGGTSDWPELREYVRRKYPDELDEDLITMIEDLIERRRERRYGRKNP